ncbi:MAG: chromosomal replication initiator protein DnaA [Patescibacteria group bacterium]
MTNEELWQSALNEMEFEVSRANFATWFRDTILQHVQEGVATIAVPNAFAKEWLEKKFHKQIMRSLRTNVPEIRSAVYVVHSTLAPQQPQIQRKSQQQDTSDEQLDFKEFSVDQETYLNPKYTFESFIVGSFNELAHAAALALSQNLGTLHNPFFVYGGVGLGKTHLLHAIGNQIKKDHPSYKVLYLTSERFVNELITMLQNRESIQIFKEKYRTVDLLIVDDVQFIAGKTKSEEELFHTFNSLYERGKQVVFSSDKPPQAIQNLEERLRSRFQAGLTVDISEPEFEARLAILRTKAESRDFPIPSDIMDYIASTVQKNIRELEGALNILIAKSKLKGRILTLEEIKTSLEQLTNKAKKVVTTSQIIKAVSEFYDLGETGLFERSRRREVVKPRQLAMYLLREDFHGSYPFIGEKLGGRDHTTALHAYEKISRELKEDVKLVEELKLIRAKIYES